MFKYISELPFILASGSPRRKELISSINIQFTVISPDCDESVLPDEDPESMVRRLSILKAKDVASKNQKAWILAADTTVFLDKNILGKPADKKEAFEMLSALSGKWHQVWGGVTICNTQTGYEITQAYCTEVLMRKLSADQINKFIETGEPMDKAGAYAIQGAGAGLVSEIKGSYTNVVGLNLAAVIDILIKNSVIK